MILIAGGAGYIGSHMNKMLNLRGKSTLVVDNLSCGNRWAVKWGEFLEGDLADEKFLEDIFSQLRQLCIFQRTHMSESLWISRQNIIVIT